MVTETEILQALRNVYDPELGVNVVDLGLIYNVTVNSDWAAVDLTLTTQGCPLHDTIGKAVRRALLQVPGIGRADVNIVWEPAWVPEMISPAGRQALGWE